MISFLEAVIFGAIGSLLAVGIQLSISRLKEHLSERVIRGFWNFKHKSVVIVHPVYNQSSGESLPPNYSRIEDMLAVHSLIAFFKERGMKYTIQDEHRDILQESDLILICSPKGNSKSAAFAKEHDLPYRFCYTEKEPKNSYFFEEKVGVKYRSPMDSDEKEIDTKNDLGLVARYTDKNLGRRIFLFWGIHGIGTAGAVKFVLDPQNLKELSKATHGRDCAFLIKIPFVNSVDIGNPKQYTIPYILD